VLGLVNWILDRGLQVEEDDDVAPTTITATDADEASAGT
jgi:hypothetical protein